MFKYLMLCVSMLLVLPGYAAVIVDSGSWAKSCAPDTTWFGITNKRREAGKMTINVTGIKLKAGVDNRGVTVSSPRFDCHNLTGFTFSVLTKRHLGFVQSNPALTWIDGEYFKIGNGLAMKLMVGDNNLSQVPLTQSPPSTITFPEVQANRNPEELGVAVQATLKVVGNVVSNTDLLEVEIGTFEYRMRNYLTNLGTTVYAPIVFNISVQQAAFLSCTLDGFDGTPTPLQPVSRAELKLSGDNGVHGGNIILGPVICEPGVDVKVSFFDNNSAGGLKDYLRTVYSDDNTPSPYALRLYPEGSEQAVEFLPHGLLQEGQNALENETTINFTQSTTTGENSQVSKSFSVKYLKISDGDRVGKIKGIMTVQFLYY